LDDVLTFDASVVNGDRKAQNPNLLWDGAENVYVIDHGLACPAYLWSDAERASSPLMPDAEVQKHSSYRFLRNKGSLYDRVPGHWEPTFDSDFWRDLRAVVPSTWETKPGELDKIFSFLEARSTRFPVITRDLRRIMQ
jgi:hypothetical protein